MSDWTDLQKIADQMAQAMVGNLNRKVQKQEAATRRNKFYSEVKGIMQGIGVLIGIFLIPLISATVFSLLMQNKIIAVLLIVVFVVCYIIVVSGQLFFLFLGLAKLMLELEKRILKE